MEESKTPEPETTSTPETDASTPETDTSAATTPAGKQAPKITKKTAVVGAAIGIGSAAIVAALLYANRNNSGKKS